MPDVLLSSNSGASRVLTFNRPDSLNAFNQDLWYALSDALDAAAVDDAVRCVLLTGTGRAFSAGQDLTEMADPSIFKDSEPGYEHLMPTLETFPKPLLAAVNGVGVGIGLTILLHCDMVLIASDARLKVPFMSLGVTTEAAASLLLPATTGRQRAAGSGDHLHRTLARRRNGGGRRACSALRRARAVDAGSECVGRHGRRPTTGIADGHQEAAERIAPRCSACSAGQGISCVHGAGLDDDDSGY